MVRTSAAWSCTAEARKRDDNPLVALGERRWYDFPMSDTVVVKVGPKGRIVIPAALRHRFGLVEGDELVIVAEPHGMRLIDRSQLIDELDGLLREGQLRDGIDVVDELIADRRADAVADRSV
jgi:AbrB family looped-hinge helix DNA binding protein